jgi:hypothetical protein
VTREKKKKKKKKKEKEKKGNSILISDLYLWLFWLWLFVGRPYTPSPPFFSHSGKKKKKAFSRNYPSTC